MALNAYLKLKGQKQGEIKGSVTQKGRENKIMVIAVSHEVSSPRDAASGLATGKRQHKPIVITKELDKSTPLLYDALVKNEMITEWELQFWSANRGGSAAAGKETQHYTVKLEGVSIVDIRFVMLNNMDPNLVKFSEYEEIAFSYKKITWIWNDGGIMAQDDLGKK